MSLAALALLTLAAVLILGLVRPDLNVGLLALAATVLLGTLGAGLPATELSALFPSNLLLTVLGVTLLFGMAGENGTLERLTAGVLRLVSHRPRRLPAVFFALSLALSALGPGNIASVALLAPVALPAALRAGVSPLLMSIVLCTGANAGTFSPVAVTGSLNTALLQQIGLDDPALPLRIFLTVAALQSLSAALAWGLFGRRQAGVGGAAPASIAAPLPPLEPAHRWTLAAVMAFLVAVTVFGVPAGPGAFVLAAGLSVLRAADAEATIRALPWSVILLIAGVGTLVNLLGETGSLTLATGLLAQFAGPGSLHALLAFVTGLASLGSSSSGVVMPLFVPLVPELLGRLGGGDPLTAVIAIDVGSHMVDVSPLSTLGALCLAALPTSSDRPRVFRALLLWGLAMSLLGAAIVWLAFDLA